MRLRISHKTAYRFDTPMLGLVQSHRLTPSRFDGQKTLSWKIGVEGAVQGAGFRDGAGDRVETMTLRGPVQELVVEVIGEVDTTDLAGVLRGHRETVSPLAYLRPGPATEPDAALKDLASAAVAGIEGTAALERAHALSGAVAGAIAYRPGETHEHTTAAEALAQGSGVCQDHAHALIAAAQSQGIAARYVTGYLHSAAGDDAPEASHAWAEIHVWGLGWVGFDAANGVCPDERYVRIGSGLDALDAAPIRGVASGAGAEAMEVELAVQQVQQ